MSRPECRQRNNMHGLWFLFRLAYVPPESAENRERDRELQRSMSHVRRCLLESRMLLVHKVLGSRGACRVVGLVLTLCYAIRDRGYTVRDFVLETAVSSQPASF